MSTKFIVPGMHIALLLYIVYAHTVSAYFVCMVERKKQKMQVSSELEEISEMGETVKKFKKYVSLI